MTFEKILLALIAISFLGFMAGLIGKNTGNHKKKTLRSTEVYSYILAVSVIALLLAAVIYSILYT
jgi:hypothetical protein